MSTGFGEAGSNPPARLWRSRASLRPHAGVPSPASRGQFPHAAEFVPAFVQMTGQLYEAMRKNNSRLPLLKSLDVPVKVIWGEYDPFLSVELVKERASLFKEKLLSRYSPAGHWLQSDQPELVAKELLS